MRPSLIKYQGRLYRRADAAAGSLQARLDEYLLSIAKTIKKQVGAQRHPSLEVPYAGTVKLEGYRKKITWRVEISLQPNYVVAIHCHTFNPAEGGVSRGADGQVPRGDAPAAAIARVLQHLHTAVPVGAPE